MRRLPAEVLIDAISQAMGTTEKLSSLPVGTKVLEVPWSLNDQKLGNPYVEHALTVFGRSPRNSETVCDCERETTPSVVQSLMMANHPEILRRIAAKDGRVGRLLKEQRDPARQIETLFLWTLSRRPTDVEQRICLDHLKSCPTAAQGLEEVMWSLLNRSEFLLNH